MATGVKIRRYDWMGGRGETAGLEDRSVHYVQHFKPGGLYDITKGCTPTFESNRNSNTQ